MKYIGVDLGGTHIGAGLVDANGCVIKILTQPTLKGREPEAIFDDIIGMSRSLIEEFKIGSELQGIGIGSTGMIDSQNTKIVYSNTLNITDFDVSAYINRELNFKVCIANDADCAALGEVTVGGAKGYKDVIVLTLGTGVGGGIILNGRIFSGYFPGGTEVGHQIIIKDGKQCSCGNRGCLEAYASATGLVDQARQSALSAPESLLNKLVEGDLTKMNAKIPFDAAKQGDQIALGVIDDYITYLGIGVTNLINIFKPQMILIGGGVSKQGDYLIKPLTKKVSTQVYGKDFRTLIQTAKLGNDAGIVGAAMLVKD